MQMRAYHTQNKQVFGEGLISQRHNHYGAYILTLADDKT